METLAGEWLANVRQCWRISPGLSLRPALLVNIALFVTTYSTVGEYPWVVVDVPEGGQGVLVLREGYEAVPTTQCAPSYRVNLTEVPHHTSLWNNTKKQIDSHHHTSLQQHTNKQFDASISLGSTKTHKETRK